MKMLLYKTGDIFKENAEAIVNTVNCVGAMGRGIALQFKKTYPENFKVDIISILHVSDCYFFPRTEFQSQVVQPTGNDHNQISKPFDPVSAFVFNNSVSFDTTYNMFYSDSYF